MKPVCCNCSCGRLAFLMEVKAPRYGRIGELFFYVALARGALSSFFSKK